MNKISKQYHLVVYWSEENGWQITEMEPASEGFIYTCDELQTFGEWKYADEPEEDDKYAELTQEFYAKLNPNG